MIMFTDLQVIAVAVLILASVSCVAEAAVEPPENPGMAVVVQPGTYTVRGHKVTIDKVYRLPIDRPEEVEVKSECQVLSDEKPVSFGGGTALNKTCGPIDAGIRLPYAIVSESVRVHSSEDGGAVYEEGRDYFLDHQWGGLSRVDTGRVTKDTKVYIDYKVTLERIDVILVSKNGTITLKKGKSAPVLAVAPSPDAGCIALANVYIPYRCSAITTENILPAPEKDITWRDFIKTSGREYLQNTIRLLNENKPVSIVCWGDSVTVGCSVVPLSNGYTERFRRALSAAYPGSEIHLVNAGIGATHTDTRLGSFDKEVLSYNPNLITVEFVNDCSYPAEKIIANWNKFIAQARLKNPKVEIIVITPSFTMPNIFNDYNGAVDAMRRVAEDNKVALADTTNIWANLSKVGIPYLTLLANGINHPNDLGHDFFTAGLMDLLKPAEDR